MPARLNHLAVFAAAIAFFLWGWLWYGFIVLGPYTALMGGHAMTVPPMTYLWSFLLGLVMSYFVAIALTNHEAPQPARHGIEFGIFMGVGIWSTLLLNGYLYAGLPIALWAINAAYVVIGLAIVGAIVSGWRKKAAV